MWWDEPEDIHEFFSKVEDEGEIPEREILGEDYFILPQGMWSEWLEEWEMEGEDIQGLDTDGQNGSAYYEALEDESLIVVDHQRPENEVRATSIHEETHIATGIPADRFNVEGVAYARENLFRKNTGLEEFQIDYYPLLSRVIDQWTESYEDAAAIVGDERALEIASETLNEYDPTLIEQVKTPLQNPYVETFEEKVRKQR